MSGLKEGDFQESLERLMENLDRFVKLSRDSSSRFSADSLSSDVVSSVIEQLDSISFSRRAREFASEECHQLEEEIAMIRSQLYDVSRQLSQANEFHENAYSNQSYTESYIEEIRSRVESICQQAQDKIDTTSYLYLALDDEVEAIDELNDEIWENVRSSERAAENMLSQAHDMQAAAQGALSALERRCAQARERLSQLETLAERREKTMQDSERYADEIAMHEQTINKYDHARFMPDGYGELQARKQRFEGLYRQRDFAACSQDGPKLVEDFKVFADKLTALVQAFQTAEQLAQSQLKAAQDELAGIDLLSLSRWSQKGAEVQAAVAQLEECAKEIERISREGNRAAEFEAPCQMITAAITSLRALVDEATDNHARYDARDGIRKAIRDALSALKYDKPIYYFQEKLADGSPDELSGLTIYAHNPAETGNMRLTIDLDSKVSFEVFREDANGNELEVSQKDAVACHAAVQEFGRQMASSGIRLKVTNWGKAADLPEAQERDRITWNDINPDKQEKQFQRIQERTLEREKEKTPRRN